MLLCAYLRLQRPQLPIFRAGSQQVAGSLQDSSLAVMLQRFDVEIDAQQRNIYENNPEYQFRSDVYVAYLSEHNIA